MLVIWRRRRACAVGGMSQEIEKSEPAVPGSGAMATRRTPPGAATASPAGLAVTGEVAG